MRQLKIIDKYIKNDDISHCINNYVILSNNEFDNSISVDFILVENDKIKFIISHE